MHFPCKGIASSVFPLWSDLGLGMRPLPLKIRNPSSLRMTGCCSWRGWKAAGEARRLHPKREGVIRASAARGSSCTPDSSPSAWPRRAPDNQPLLRRWRGCVRKTSNGTLGSHSTSPSGIRPKHSCSIGVHLLIKLEKEGGGVVGPQGTSCRSRSGILRAEGGLLSSGKVSGEE